MRLLNRAVTTLWHSVAGNEPRLAHRPVISRLALVLIIALPLIAWSSTSSTADQADIAGAHDSGRPAPPTPPTPEQITPTASDAGEPTSDRYNLALGKSVFNHTCLTCHGNSVRDAPRVGDMHAWQPRLTQGLDVLIQHALNGHGRMPAKGGYSSLTDYEVSSAVAYVYQVGTDILAKQENPVSHTGCDPVSNLDKCTPADLKRLLVLQMLWLLGGPHR